MRLPLPIAVLAVALAAAHTARAEGDPARGEKAFAKCRICHDIGADARKKIGPPLNNIVGARLGGQEGFRYSQKMRELGEEGATWTEELLSDYLLDPRKVVPGGIMAFPGLRKDEERADIIAYMKQFSPQ